jgi:ubiquinone/menaquinone biosynthesis C-methylase UbiE
MNNPDNQSVTEYWNRYNVTQHHEFNSIEESLEFLDYRNDLYVGHIERMPLSGHGGKVVVDYGCGPGHDMAGFAHFSKPERLIGLDVSLTSLMEAQRRLKLHGAEVEFKTLESGDAAIPLDSNSVDYIHCCGVLHHLVDPVATMKEFNRVLKAGGEARIMVYHYDSIWLHLYVAYQIMLVENKISGVDPREIFARTTDGPDCPISRIYKIPEFSSLAEAAGLKAEFIGTGIKVTEAHWCLALRLPALADRRLPTEHRKFLIEIEFDKRMMPLYRGNYAGKNGYYSLRKV